MRTTYAAQWVFVRSNRHGSISWRHEIDPAQPEPTHPPPMLILSTTEAGKSRIQLRADENTVWLTQLEMADLFATTKQNISLHLQNIFEDGELREAATVKDSLTAQIERRWVRTTEDSSVVQAAGGKGICRAFSPRETGSTGFLGRCPRLVWRWAFGPESQTLRANLRGRTVVWRWAFGPETRTAPTARFHTSLGQRPRYATPTQIEG